MITRDEFNALCAFRENPGITQRQLADILGVSLGTANSVHQSLEKAKLIEDRAARDVLVKEYEQAMARARARRHLIELHGTDHQKERIAILVEEYGWKDIV